MILTSSPSTKVNSSLELFTVVAEPIIVPAAKPSVAPVVKTSVAVVAEPIIVPAAKSPDVPVAETTIPVKQSIDRQVSKKPSVPEKAVPKTKKEIKERAPEQAPKATKPVAAKEPAQMVIPGMNTSVSGTDPVIDFLNKQKVPYVDKRSKNGSLWLVGGPELAGIVP